MLAAHIIRLFCTSGAGLLLQVTAGIIAARVVGPEAVGVVAWMGIWPMYVMGIIGGVIIGAERNVPMARGQENPRRAEAYLSVVWKITTRCSFAILISLALIGLFFPGLDPTTRLKWCGTGGVIFATLLNAYALMGLSTSRPTRLLHVKTLAEGVGWWILLPLVLFGASGLAGRLIIITAGVPLFLIFRHRLNAKAPWRPQHLRSLAQVGYPIMITRMALLLLYGLDKTLIALFETDLALGHYSLVALVFSFIKLIPMAISRIVGPKLGEEYGKNNSRKTVAHKALRVLPPIMASIIPILAIGYWLAEPLTLWILPDFLPGLSAARISLLAGVFIAPLSLYVVYNLTGQQKGLLLCLGCGLVAHVLITLIGNLYGLGLDAFAWGFVAGMGTAGVLTLLGVVRMARAPGDLYL